MISPLVKSERQKVDALIEFRNNAIDYTLEKSRRYKRILDTLYSLNSINLDRKNDNLLKLLGDKYFLLNCFEKVKVNTGALTPGTDKETIDELSEDKFE